MPELAFQFGPAADAVPALPAPPVLEHLLLEQPLGLVAALVFFALVAFIVLIRAGQDRRAVIIGASLLLASAAVYALASAVTTTREKLAKQTESLIAAATKADLGALDRMLAGDATLTFRSPGPPLHRDQILRLVEQYPGGKTPILAWSVEQMQAAIDGPNTARTQAQVRTEVEAYGYKGPISSWWRISWRQDAGTDQWRILGIECLYIPGVTSATDLR